MFSIGQNLVGKYPLYYVTYNYTFPYYPILGPIVGVLKNLPDPIILSRAFSGSFWTTSIYFMLTIHLMTTDWMSRII